MSENTFTAYLGAEFQQRLVWQLLVEPEFAEKTIPELAVEYFDDPNFKRLYLIILEYLKEYGKVPNLQNQSILQAINEYKTPNNIIEEESLFAVIKRIELWNERVLNKQLLHDGDSVQKATNFFIKQQEYRKIGELILSKTKSGEMRNKRIMAEIEDKFQKVSTIGSDDDEGTDVTEGIERALRKEFRQTIPTGVETLDTLTGGGLGKGEIGLILTPSGVGKSTLLTKIANTARELDYNVLQIIFEDTEDQIKRKHYTIWTGVKLSDIDDNNDYVIKRVNEKIASLGNKGKLIIKKFSQEDTTMKDIRAFIASYQKKHGFKFDIVVLDYLDCLDSHKKTADRNEAELVIIKSFEAMAGDLNIPCWSAIQTNRTGFDAELVEAHQSGGNIKRIQKAHFFMSVAKTPDQKEAHLANIRIIKARFAQDGQTFKDCIFNNDSMQIIINDDRYASNKYKGLKKYGEAEIEKLESKTNAIHAKLSDKLAEEQHNEAVLESLKDSYLNNLSKTNKEFNGAIEGANEGIKTNDIEEFSTPFELDETYDAANDVVGDVANDAVSDGVNDDVIPNLGWTGETFTTAIEVEVVNHNSVTISEKVYVTPTNDLLLIDPDAPEQSQKHVFDILKKSREGQNVIKKE